MAITPTARERALPRFHFIGGKGGVGKTTCAAAYGLAAARAGARVLVASTDPAPSLGDAFEVPLTGSPRRIPLSGASLYGVEIRGPASLRRWLDGRRAMLEKIAIQGTWLDADDVERLLALSLPGIDELASLFEIDRLSRSRTFTDVVVDTAPTGHTLRMLAMPETLAAVAGVFDLMRDKGRTIEAALSGRWAPRAEDHLVEELAATARRLSALVRDASHTRFTWVTLPEPLAVAETQRAIQALRDDGIDVTTVVFNRVTSTPSSRCGHCDTRRAFERRVIRSAGFSGTNVCVEERSVEPRGAAQLKAIASALMSDGRLAPASSTGRTWRAAVDDGQPALIDDVLQASTRLLMLGGKGGVGKTTCAAAIAAAAARRWPARRTLLLSVDPAHSLGDVLGVDVGDTPVQVSGGLFARELNAARILQTLRSRYEAAIDRVFDRISGGSIDASHDRSVMRRLIELAPPGLDELAAVIDITEDLAGDATTWDLVVMDTAPTGHALRLLEAPALLEEWTRTLMAILLKYQEVASIGPIGSLLLDLSRGVKRLRALLADRERSAFVVVTRAAALPRLETGRLVRTLKRLDVSVPAIVLNAWGRGTCQRCRRVVREQSRELATLEDGLPRRRRPLLAVAPAQVPPPSGVRALAEWHRRWRRR